MTVNGSPVRRRAIRRRLPAGLVISAVLAFAAVGCATAPSVGAGAVGAGAVGRAPATTEVAGDEPVVLDGAAVRTPCFSYRLPADEDVWALDPTSEGCSTAIMFGDDILSAFFVRAQTVSGTIRELGAQSLAVNSGDGVVSRLDVISLSGKEVARVVTPIGQGLEVASYTIQLRDSGLAHKGSDIGSIVITTMHSPWYEDVVAEIIASLRRADGTEL